MISDMVIIFIVYPLLTASIFNTLFLLGAL